LKILAVDIGTGTQDIYLFDSRLDPENGLKLVLPSPTMMIHRRIRAATRAGNPIAMIGRQMGGGPSAWAAEAHTRAGLATYATPDAALTLDDDLDKVAAAGVQIISEDEAQALKADVVRIELGDFDFQAITRTFAAFGVELTALDAAAVAVFDHGAAPRGVSDRQFRFDYLDRRIRAKGALSAFAYVAADVPELMSRLKTVARTASELDCPMVVMDTAPAAVLGATFDPAVRRRDSQLIVNVGNFHTLAFRLQGSAVNGVFEHHTGEIDRAKLESLLWALANGTLKHQDVFNDMGHGALVYEGAAMEWGQGDYDIVVTGPRRSMLQADDGDDDGTASLGGPRPRPYFAVPFGDMMLAGCIGLIAATADVLPELGDEIESSLAGRKARGTAPWDAM
jgi:uncharacterized protein (DUF1786 family)